MTRQHPRIHRSIESTAATIDVSTAIVAPPGNAWVLWVRRTTCPPRLAMRSASGGGDRLSPKSHQTTISTPFQRHATVQGVYGNPRGTLSEHAKRNTLSETGESTSCWRLTVWLEAVTGARSLVRGSRSPPQHHRPRRRALDGPSRPRCQHTQSGCHRHRDAKTLQGVVKLHVAIPHRACRRQSILLKI